MQCIFTPAEPLHAVQCCAISVVKEHMENATKSVSAAISNNNYFNNHKVMHQKETQNKYCSFQNYLHLKIPKISLQTGFRGEGYMRANNMWTRKTDCIPFLPTDLKRCDHFCSLCSHAGLSKRTPLLWSAFRRTPPAIRLHWMYTPLY